MKRIESGRLTLEKADEGAPKEGSAVTDTRQGRMGKDQRVNESVDAEKKNSALDNTTDTGKTSERGKRNDTATPQSTVSDGKVANNSASDQEDGV